MLIAPVVVAAVQAALEAIDKHNFADWQNHVSDKLDEISRKLDVVILEIQRLRGYIDERITKESVDLFEGEINARRKTVEQILAGVPSSAKQPDKDTVQRLVRIMDEMDVPLWQLMNWKKFGFDPYSGVVVGVLTKLLLLRVTGRPAGEASTFARKAVEAYFAPALDVNTAGSIENARNVVATQAIHKNAELNSYLNRWWLIYVHQYTGHGHDPDHSPNDRVIVDYANAAGTLDGGIKVTVSGDENLRAPWYPRIGHDDDHAEEHFRADLEGQRQVILDALRREAELKAHAQTVKQVSDALEKYKTV
ncbi:hypothetical protein PPGU19_093040 (plasmid) [Paraburkholderia sp. PGU19]|nr:hypothetical protein PPGU19_093040 [Paraburkholderia sp. PGU19]